MIKINHELNNLNFATYEQHEHEYNMNVKNIT